jgi:hypothetical protein
MPAFLAKDDWATWLGKNGNSPDEAKACLEIVEGINWKIVEGGARRFKNEACQAHCQRSNWSFLTFN